MCVPTGTGDWERPERAPCSAGWAPRRQKSSRCSARSRSRGGLERRPIDPRLWARNLDVGNEAPATGFGRGARGGGAGVGVGCAGPRRTTGRANGAREQKIYFGRGAGVWRVVRYDYGPGVCRVARPGARGKCARLAAARSRGGDIRRISRMHGDCSGTHQIACLSSPLGEANPAMGAPKPEPQFFVFQFFRSNLKIAPRLRHSASSTARCPWTVRSGRRHSERFLRCALPPQTHPCAPTVTARDSLVLVSATYNGR